MAARRVPQPEASAETGRAPTKKPGTLGKTAGMPGLGGPRVRPWRWRAGLGGRRQAVVLLGAGFLSALAGRVKRLDMLLRRASRPDPLPMTLSKA